MSQFPDTARASEYGAGSRDYFKFEKGDNRLRVLALAQDPVATHFISKGERAVCIGVSRGCKYHGENAPKGDDGKPKKPSVKYPAYVVDRKTNDIRLVYLPYSVVTALGDLKKDADWSFEELPMPYDVTVKYDPDASGTDMYKVVPSPKSAPITSEIRASLETMKSIDEVADAQRDKAAAETEHAGEIDLGDESEPYHGQLG
jgi:hypothetical protein